MFMKLGELLIMLNRSRKKTCTKDPHKTFKDENDNAQDEKCTE